MTTEGQLLSKTNMRRLRQRRRPRRPPAPPPPTWATPVLRTSTPDMARRLCPKGRRALPQGAQLALETAAKRASHWPEPKAEGALAVYCQQNSEVAAQVLVNCRDGAADAKFSAAADGAHVREGACRTA